MSRQPPTDPKKLSLYETFSAASGHFARSVLPEINHCHDEIELNYINRGAVKYLFASETIELQKGQVAAFWGVIPHRLCELINGGELYWITVPVAWFLKWKLPGDFSTNLLFGKMIIDQQVSELDGLQFPRWAEDLCSSDVERHRITLMEVEARYRRLALASSTVDLPNHTASTKTELASSPLQTAQRLAQYFVKHYDEPISITKTAKAFGIHPSYASRVFRQTFGISMVAYLTQYRLASAQRLLSTTDRSITDIALDSGFGSLSRFYAAFRDFYGISPGAYRDLINNDAGHVND